MNKQKNLDHIWKVKQEKDENPALFLNQLTEAFKNILLLILTLWMGKS